MRLLARKACRAQVTNGYDVIVPGALAAGAG